MLEMPMDGETFHFINRLETELILGDDLKCKIYLLITGSKGKRYDREGI